MLVQPGVRCGHGAFAPGLTGTQAGQPMLVPLALWTSENGLAEMTPEIILAGAF
jgi:hypothetical protein